MRGKISTTVSTTSKPNGGYHSGFNAIDERSAGVSMGRGDFAEASSLLVLGKHPDELFTPQGASALMCCITQNDSAFAQRLLLAGANPDAPKGKAHDKTYLGLILSGASASLSQPMLELFLCHGSKPNIACNSAGDFPLGFAVSNALVGPAKLLAHYGADPFLLNSEGLNSVEIALNLPDFQKSLMLWSILKSPCDVQTREKLLENLGNHKEPVLEWIVEATKTE